MAYLRDTVIVGDFNVTNETRLAKLYTDTLMAPTSNNGTTYGIGTAGQVLTSNGTSIYWGAKPSYTYSEVGAAASSHTHGDISNDGKLISNTSSPEEGSNIVITKPTGEIEKSDISFGNSTSTYLRNDGEWSTPISNTVGSINSSSKMYLIGALSQTTSTQTYSNSKVYATDGQISAVSHSWNVSGTEKVHMDYNTTTQALDFIFD